MYILSKKGPGSIPRPFFDKKRAVSYKIVF